MKKKEIRGLLVILTLIGILSVFSSSAVFSFDRYGSRYYMAAKQIIFFMLAWLVFMGAQFFTGKRAIALMTTVLTVISILGLIVVLANGAKINNARRWISIFGVTFQPSELFKLSALLLMAMNFDQKGNMVIYDKRRGWEFGNIFRLSIIVAGLLLVLLEPDLGTTVLIALALFGGLFMSRVRTRWILLMIVVGAIALSSLIAFSPYRRQRVKALIKGGGEQTYNYQRLQAMRAIKKGGIFGNGPGRGRMKVFQLPEAWSDFVFCVISEETGLLGGLLLILIYMLLFSRIFNIVKKTKNRQLQYFTLMFLILLIMQVGVNIGVAVGALPPTGMVLPLISSGGSALIAFMLGFGLVEAVRKRNDR